MEIPRWLRLGKKNAPQTPPAEQLNKYLVKGERLSRQDSLAELLELEGDDAQLLYMLRGLTLINTAADSKMEIFRFRVHGETVQTTRETERSMSLRNLAQSMLTEIEDFAVQHYAPDNLNRAWTIRSALNDLFSQTLYINQSTGISNRGWDALALIEWSNKWKPIIQATTHTT